MASSAAAVGVGGLLIGAIIGFGGSRLLDRDTQVLTASGSKQTTTVAAERRTLEVSEETTGELSSSVSRSITTVGTGTITTAATVGATVDRGGVIARIDDQPVVLLIGEQPVWREINPDVTVGADVRQLEENLVAMGFDPSGMAVDTEYTSDTEDAIVAWETALGLTEPDGIVPLSQISFATTSLQITEATTAGTRVSPGDSLGAGRPVTTEGIKLTFSVTEEADRYQVGNPVTVVMSDDSTVNAKITAIDRVASGGQPGASTSFTVTAAPDASAGVLSPGPVTVRIPTEIAKDALAVPSRALVAVVEGGQAVQLADSGTLVAVDAGVFADGWVQVTGAAVDDGSLAEGVEVVVPS